MVDLIANFNAARSHAFDAPIPGFEYLNFFDVGADGVGRSLVKGAAAPQVKGAPTFGAGYTSFAAATSWVDTLVPDTAEYTTFFAGLAVGAMDTSATRPIFGGTFAYGPNSGHAIYVRSATQVSASVWVNLSGTATLRIADLVTPPTAWALYAARCTAAALTITDLTHGLTASIALDGPRVLSPYSHNVGKLGGSGAGAGVSEVLGYGHLRRAVTDAEMDAVHEMFRYRAAQAGIVI